MKRMMFSLITGVFTMCVLLIGFSGIVGAERTQREVPITTSSGKISIVNAEGYYIMLQKENGKKVSLELTSESEVTLDGKAITLDQLSLLEPGFPATAVHFTNEAGMQRALRLTVETKVLP